MYSLSLYIEFERWSSDVLISREIYILCRIRDQKSILSFNRVARAKRNILSWKLCLDKLDREFCNSYRCIFSLDCSSRNKIRYFSCSFSRVLVETRAKKKIKKTRSWERIKILRKLFRLVDEKTKLKKKIII